jgi:hypothetical protein
MIRTNPLRPCIKSGMYSTRESCHTTSMSDGCAAQHTDPRAHSHMVRKNHLRLRSGSATIGAAAGKQIYRNFFMDLCYSSFTEQGVQLRRIAVD